MTVIQMSGQELIRLRIMIDLADNRITIEAAAALMGLGRRQVNCLRVPKVSLTMRKGKCLRFRPTPGIPWNTGGRFYPRGSLRCARAWRGLTL